MANTTWSTTDKAAALTLSGSNLTVTSSSAGGGVRAIDKQIAGKFYWEITATTIALTSTGVGVASPTASLAAGANFGATPGTCGLLRTGLVYVDGISTGITLGAITSGTVICVAYDADERLAWFRLGAAGNWNANASNNPATGVGGIASRLGRGIPAYPTYYAQGNLEAATANFGDTAFTGAVPSGYTSGFIAGVTSPTNAIASQALAEHWLTTNPDARITQVVAEHWASVASGNLQAVVTQVAIEHWMSVAVVVPAAGGPMVTMIG